MIFLSVGICCTKYFEISYRRKISVESLKINWDFYVERENVALIGKRPKTMARISPINRDGLWCGPRPTETGSGRRRRTEKRQGDRKIGERLGVHWRGNRRDKRAEASPLIVGRAAWNSTSVCARATSVGVRSCWKVHYITTLGVATFPAARASWLIVKLLHRRYLLVNGVGLTNREYISRSFLHGQALAILFFYVVPNSCTSVGW